MFVFGKFVFVGVKVDLCDLLVVLVYGKFGNLVLMVIELVFVFFVIDI